MSRLHAIRVASFSLVILSAIAGSLAEGRTIAQSVPTQPLPACLPPQANQFLLLVVNQRPDTQAQLRQLLPASAVLTPCTYLSTSVVRVEGFSSAEIANAWAKYLSDRAGLQTFVTRSATSTMLAPATPPAPSPPPASAQPAPPAGSEPYNPQPLGAGYAVLVNYSNRPEVAIDVSQITRTVGLAAYNERPYLLAMHTPDEAAAAAMLRTLSDRGLTAVIVDGRRVMLLRPSVVGVR